MVRKAPEPYLAIQDPKIMMAGKGAPRSTVFGVLGRLPKNEEKVGVKSLGGLIQDTKAGHALGAGAYMSEKEALRIPGQTERKILGPVSKTRMPGVHYSQIPYPGFFMKAVGPRL